MLKGNYLRKGVGGWLVVLLLSVKIAMGQPDVQARNYLSTTLKTSGFHLMGKELAAWKAAEKENYVRKIRQLPDLVKAQLVEKADRALSFDWPSLPASVFLEYQQNGNRVRFERLQTERRDCLNSLVIGELVTGRQKYLPQIVNGLWATLEESTWEIPAIVVSQKAGAGLPDPEEEVIGLVSAETGAMIAVIEYMLHDQLRAVSPMIIKRIDRELHKRILDPYRQRDDFWWMGLKGQPVNNWNAWINTNVLQTGLLAESDTAILSELVEKVFRSTDNFINQYAEDGGCDEGPAYWNLAGGKLVRLLHLAHGFSGGKLGWSSNSLLHAIGKYIGKMHIEGTYFVNFADATPETIPDPESVYRFGEMFNDDSLKHFAAYLFALKKQELPGNHVVAFLDAADVFDPLTRLTPDAMLMPFSSLPDLQVFTARSLPVTGPGLFLAVQGGHNGESHNHNDVGNFILYANGKPVIIDAGVGTYTAQTFSSRRYELWNMQSQWHNCPVINGVMQKDGKAFHASAVSFEEQKEVVKIDMDLAKAYPEEAFVQQWTRSFRFDQRAGKIVLAERYTLKKRTGETAIHFMSACIMKETKKGTIYFYDATGGEVLLLQYAPESMTISMEEKELEDEKLAHAWGKKLYRLSLVIKDNKAVKGANRYVFSLPETAR